MDDRNIMKKFEHMMELKYKHKIITMQKHLIIDYRDLIRISPEIEEELFYQPDNVIKLAEISLNKELVPKYKDTKKDDYRIRIKNHESLKSNVIRIKDLNKNLSDKFISIKGVIKSYSEKIKVPRSIRYECRSCATIWDKMLMRFCKIDKPRCPECGSRQAIIMGKNEIDERQAILEEDPESLGDNHRPEQIKILIQDTILYSEADEILGSGMQVTITGILKDEPVVRHNTETGERRYILEANYIKLEDDEFVNYKITKDDEKIIKNLSTQDNVFEKFIDTFANHISGNREIKKALILQMFGGVTKQLNPKQKLRGSINILLLGDPSTGKSRLTKSIMEYCPRSRYASGGGSSGVGLTASVKKDELIGGWVLEPGAMILAHNSVAVLDEFDKLDDDEKGKLHEAMSEGTISISKAGIHATLQCNTGVLCSANPKHGKFHSFSNIAKEINLPPALISRFDMIILLKDKANIKKDRNVITSMIESHKLKKEVNEDLISKDLFKKYIIYAKKYIQPELTLESEKIIKDYYVSMRNQNLMQSQSLEKINEKDNPITITPRDGENLIRASEGVAKIYLSKKIKGEHVKEAIEILNYFKCKIYKELGVMDSSLFEIGKSFEETVVEDQFDQCVSSLPLNKWVDELDFIDICVNKGINKERVKQKLNLILKEDKILMRQKDKIMRVM